MSHALEELLKSQYANPVESTGGFTMDVEKALEKIAKFQLPYFDAWVVKLGQGVVLSGAESLDIQQTSTGTTFEFTPQDGPSIDLITSFFDPTNSPYRWWQHFRSSLWAVGINLRRPFKIDFFGERYFWDGFKMHILESGFDNGVSPGRIFLDLSHRTLEEGKGLPLLKDVQAKLLNSQLKKVFSEVLFSCPIRICVNELPIDGFQRVPVHGFSRESHPIKMFWIKGEPSLEIPPSTMENRKSFLGEEKLRGLSQSFNSQPPAESVKAAALLTAHAHYARFGFSEDGWKMTETKSMIYWIRHGVVIQKEEFQFRALTVSLALFASCDDMATDFTGFGLEEEAKSRVLAEICEGIESAFKQDDSELEIHDRKRHKKRLNLAGGAAVGGMLLKLVFPPALLLTGVGGLVAYKLTQSIAKVDSRLNKDLRILKEELTKLNEELK